MKLPIKHRSLAILVTLIAIIILGLILRLRAISSYLFYPDSYQSLLVAHNLQTVGRAVATMGSDGLIFPDNFAWTRPLYPAMIALGNLFGLGSAESGRIVSLLAGLAAIPVAFLLARSALGSVRYGLAAALLLAISWNHVTWGGFVFTETTGVLTVMLSLWLLLRRRQALDELAAPGDFLIGVSLAVATLARYEYAVLLLPWLAFATAPFSLRRIVTIASGFAVMGSVGLAISRPFGSGAGLAIGELHAFWPFALAAAAAVAIIALLRARGVALGKPMVIAALIVLWSFIAILIAQALGLSWLARDLSAASSFVRTDPLLCILAAGGFTVMLLSSRRRALGIFLLGSTILMALVYWRVNPTMQRYWTHLLPFIIIPAAYAMIRMAEWLRRCSVVIRYAAVTLIFAAIFGQTIYSYQGMHNWNGGIWFRPGYDPAAAKYVDGVAEPGKVLLVSLPEPYYYWTGRSTQSLTDTYPYIYLSNLAPEATIYVVEDEGMHRVFPTFTKQVIPSLVGQEVASSWIHEDFRYTADITPETHPIHVYKTTRSRLEYYIELSQKQ